MVQVIEPSLNYGQLLGQNLGSSINQGIGSALNNMLQQKQRRSQLQGLTPFLQDIGIPEEGIQQLISSGLDPQIVGSLASQLGAQRASSEKALLSHQAKIQQQMQKEESQKREAKEKQEHHLSILDEMQSLIPYTGEHKIPGFKGFMGAGLLPLNREAVEKRNQFDVLAQDLEGIMRDLTTKGMLPQKTYANLQKFLPNSTLSDRANIGRLNAFRTILNKQPDRVQQSFDQSNQKSERPSLEEIFK